MIEVFKYKNSADAAAWKAIKMADSKVAEKVF
jgi:hypothetical protein